MTTKLTSTEIQEMKIRDQMAELIELADDITAKVERYGETLIYMRDLATGLGDLRKEIDYLLTAHFDDMDLGLLAEQVDALDAAGVQAAQDKHDRAFEEAW